MSEETEEMINELSPSSFLSRLRSKASCPFNTSGGKKTRPGSNGSFNIAAKSALFTAINSDCAVRKLRTNRGTRNPFSTWRPRGLLARHSVRHDVKRAALERQEISVEGAGNAPPRFNEIKRAADSSN